MKGYIAGIDFINLPAEKYWSFPATYKGDKAAEIKQMIFSGSYCGARKIDGCHYRFIKDEPWSANVSEVICHHQNAAWDNVIDAAMAQGEKK